MLKYIIIISNCIILAQLIIIFSAYLLDNTDRYITYVINIYINYYFSNVLYNI